MPDIMENIITELKKEGHEYTFELAEEGVSGTYFVLDKKGTPIAVFKDSSQDPLSPNNTRFMRAFVSKILLNFLRPFGLFTAYEHSVQGQGYASDDIAYKLAKELNLEETSIPESVVANDILVDGVNKKGSFIRFIPNAISLQTDANILGLLENKPHEVSMSAFEEMAMVDYITGNMDRKAGNILRVKGENKLHLIDNTWAFSPLQGEAISFKQYIWGYFPLLANKHFFENTKKKIKQIYNDRKRLAELVYCTYRENNPPKETIEVSYQRAMCFLHRIEMIHELIVVQDKTFRQLSNVYCEDTFLKIHREKTEGESLLSSHFIDTKTQYLDHNGVSSKEKEKNYELSAAEKRYKRLYEKIDASSSQICKNLSTELKRLNEKQAYRNFDGFWRQRYKSKADAVNNALYYLEQSSTEGIDKAIHAALHDKSSALYSALNTHTSFFFKFTLTACSRNTRAIINLTR